MQLPGKGQLFHVNHFDGRSIILFGQIGSSYNKKLSESGQHMSALGKMRFPDPIYEPFTSVDEPRP
jgi:hypothetical protein